MRNPFAVFWVLALLGGFWVFTDTHSRWYRWTAGTLHGGAHFFATFLIGWAATYAGVSWMGYAFQSIRQLLLAAVILVMGGWIFGSCIMGVYLLVSLNVFGRHANEAFSSLAIQDYKSFLRLHIGADGRLTIFPIGIREVPRKWKAREEPLGPGLAPAVEREANQPMLIEPPIILEHPTPSPGAP